jgi:hypothetical protein
LAPLLEKVNGLTGAANWLAGSNNLPTLADRVGRLEGLQLTLVYAGIVRGGRGLQLSVGANVVSGDFRGSQISAWASPQSDVIADREWLVRRVVELEARFEGGDVPRPPFWGGYRLIPDRIDLWYNQPDRLHDRFGTNAEDGWEISRLVPDSTRTPSLRVAPIVPSARWRSRRLAGVPRRTAVANPR